MGDRFVATLSVYGSPAVYDRETEQVSVFVNDVWLVRALESCRAGGTERFVWRPEYAGEAR